MKVLITILLLLLYVQPTYAAKLIISPEASIFLHFGAAALLYAHIGGGLIGIISGVTASLSRKGAIIHRVAGKVFFISMFICYVIGALVSPFLDEGQRPNFVAAILALYLLLTGVLAAKRKPFYAGITEKIGLITALLITGLGITFMVMGQNSESGTVDGSPPQAFILFIIMGSIAAVGELNVIIKGQLPENLRSMRHLWRMLSSFFIASGSLFFGQPQVFPAWFSASILPTLFALFPLIILFIWLTKQLFIRKVINPINS